MPPALGALSPDYWATKEVPVQVILKSCFSCFREKCRFDHLFFILDSYIIYRKMDLASLQYPNGTYT